MADKPATGRGGKYNFPAAQLKRLEDDDNKRELIGKALGNILAVSRAFEEPVKNDEELCARLDWFFHTCQETNQLPTVEKMCLAIGYSDSTVWDWETGRTRGFSSATSEIIKKAKKIIAGLDAELVLDNKINTIAYVFRAKNYYGMSDKQEVVVTPNQPLGDYQDPNVIAEKYAELPDPTID